MFLIGDPPPIRPFISTVAGVTALEGVTCRAAVSMPSTEPCAPLFAIDQLVSRAWLPRELGLFVAAALDEGRRFGLKRARLALVGDRYDARDGVKERASRLDSRIDGLFASTSREVDGEVLRRLGEGDSMFVKWGRLHHIKRRRIIFPTTTRCLRVTSAPLDVFSSALYMSSKVGGGRDLAVPRVDSVSNPPVLRSPNLVPSFKRASDPASPMHDKLGFRKFESPFSWMAKPGIRTT